MNFSEDPNGEIHIGLSEKGNSIKVEDEDQSPITSNNNPS